MIKTAIYSFLFFIISIPSFAQSGKWNVNDTSGPGRSVKFTLTEGTWMNLDVSPDGKEIVFDLLGDIYSMPVKGGNAKLLRGGSAWEVQPRFSPDGSKISFTSDAGGGDNIWIMNRDSSDAHQVTKENFRLLNNAIWTPDGQYIIARKHFTSSRSLGAGELWMYHIAGGGGLRMTERKNDQQDLNEPCISSDGRYVYYSEEVYPGGYFQYNKDPNNQIFVIKSFDRTNGEINVVTGGPGGAIRPQISHDGKTLAFIRRVRTSTVLFLRNMETGEEWPLYDKLSKDQQEAWTTFGVYTGFSWMPGDKEIVIWSNGKINRIQIDKPNESQIIPFTCNSKQFITDALQFQQNIDEEYFTSKVIRSAITLKDDKTIIFQSLGHLWKKTLPNGKAERLNPIEENFEFDPSLSPDQQSVVYVTWNDTSKGEIRITSINGKSPSKRISSEKGIYRLPSFSPDGKTIVFQKEDGDNVLGTTFNLKPGIYTIPTEGGKMQFVTDKGSKPCFSAAGDKIYFQSVQYAGGSPKKYFERCDLSGNERQAIFSSTYATSFVVSPDENWIAFDDLYNVYVAAFPKTGKTIDVGANTTDFPVRKVSRDAGTNLHWSFDNQKLHYTLGEQYFTINLKESFDFTTAHADSAFKAPESGISIGIKTKMDKPSSAIAFTHARVITMKDSAVVENATVYIKGNKIISIQPSSSFNIPKDATVIDCTGKTIMPGFVDVHGHAAHFRDGITPQKHWPYFTNLAYGVTTIHDPSANTEMVFSQSELIKAGLMTGPRVFSTGTILYGAEGDFKAVINSLDDARSAVRRTTAYGAFSVKSYNQPRREQNQMVIKAARELGVEVVPEGGSFFYHNMAMILDGHTTIEHNIPIATVYDDVIKLWAASKTAYTPTLIVSYGAVSGEYYWYQHTNVWEKQRLLKFTPRSVIDPRSRHRTMLPEEEYENGFIRVSNAVRKLSNAGVNVNMGAHGQLQGLGAHWETWMLNMGGMSKMQTLYCATINGARTLGMDKYIGSLETGKLADLIILDKNPLEDIYNTESVHYTMVNGRLYECETMNQVYPEQKIRQPFYWEISKSDGYFPFHEETNSFGHMQCLEDHN